MKTAITPLVPNEATDTELVPFHALSVAASTVDRPDLPAPALESVLGVLRVPLTGPGPSLFWAAHVDGRLAAMAHAYFPEAENDHMVTLAVTVHPDLRRQGIAGEMVAALLPEVRRRGSRVVVGNRVVASGAGEQWARALGATIAHRMVVQRLVIAQTDPSLWQVAEPRGFSLEQWTGKAPEHLVASFARARRAIQDAPRGESSERIPKWTAEDVRREEEDWRERGFTLLVNAVLAADGEVAGFTEMAHHPTQPERGMQQYTAVCPEYRGHGVARFAKAAMMHRLQVELPQIKEITTGTGAQNEFMIRVNEQLGYRVTVEILTVEADVDALERRLGMPR